MRVCYRCAWSPYGVIYMIYVISNTLQHPAIHFFEYIRFGFACMRVSYRCAWSLYGVIYMIYVSSNTLQHLATFRGSKFHVFSGFPKISIGVSRELTESPSLKRVQGKTVKSGDPNILSLISSVSGVCAYVMDLHAVKRMVYRVICIVHVYIYDVCIQSRVRQSCIWYMYTYTLCMYSNLRA